MKYLAILFVIYLFLKSINYGIFEIQSKSNFSGGIFVILFSIISLTFPLILLFTIY